MTPMEVSRRGFLASAGAAAGGMALGFHVPFAQAQTALVQNGSPEINAWVVVNADDTVMVRVARAEMGQGTLTG
ncbi:MAG: twin-arginine translocation signal domain-containing protein, partial [Betaproteobacteria bacterium]|nr:twin-arginine translocation signal domain-containing protein [Betaproteobacteria bacterium]